MAVTELKYVPIPRRAIKAKGSVMSYVTLR
jgi:hypothetical protein